MPSQDVRLRLFAEAFQLGDLSVFAGLFELLDGLNAQFVVQRLDLLWAEPGNVEHRHAARRA